MAKRSGSNSISYWGQYATATGGTGLPNSAGATVQPGTFLEAGDIAYVTGTSKFYVCTTPTAGAAVWAPLTTETYVDSAGRRDVGGNTDTILATDSDTVVYYAFAGAVATSLPDLSANAGVVAGRTMVFMLQHTGATTAVTVTPAGGITINGSASAFPLTPGPTGRAIFVTKNGVDFFA